MKLPLTTFAGFAFIAIGFGEIDIWPAISNFHFFFGVIFLLTSVFFNFILKDKPQPPTEGGKCK